VIFQFKKEYFVCLCIAAGICFSGLQISTYAYYSWLLAVILFRVTPAVTRNLGLYGLIRRTGTHVPQWDSNP
jgi:sorbitol-specific phosphotransferase system component IIC